MILLLLLACEGPKFKDESRRFASPNPSDKTFPTVIHEPTSYGVLDTPLVDEETGEDFPAGTACEACHTAAPAPKPSIGAEPYHAVDIVHGALTCDQCHDQDRRQLHLADGTPVAFLDVIQLCAQCHGSQYRDYQHGAHGGGSGYWDATRGPRLKNNCVDCHEPHAPDFPVVWPVLPPRDRNPLKGFH